MKHKKTEKRTEYELKKILFLFGASKSKTYKENLVSLLYCLDFLSYDEFFRYTNELERLNIDKFNTEFILNRKKGIKKADLNKRIKRELKMLISRPGIYGEEDNLSYRLEILSILLKFKLIDFSIARHYFKKICKKKKLI